MKSGTERGECVNEPRISETLRGSSPEGGKETGGRLIFWIIKRLERALAKYDVITHNLNLSLAVFADFHRLNAFLSSFVIIHA